MRVLLLLRGSPGCGKTTWIQQNGLANYAVSADDIRMMCSAPAMFPDGSVRIAVDSDKFVWDMLFKVVENRMRRGDFTVIDATNSKTMEMNWYKKLCEDYRYRIYCVDFTSVPIEVAKQRNVQRPAYKVVPDAAIDKMYSRFETQKIPAGITVIQPDELDKVWRRKLDMSGYKKMHIIGDVHGCCTALNSYLEANGGIKDDEFYLFCGDYLDRGIENVEVLNFLLSIYNRPNVEFLEGNHERWIWNWANDEVTRSREFELFTRRQLEDAGVDKKECRKFYRRIGQCAWFDYAGKEIFGWWANEKWYDWEEDMTALSKKFPNFLFLLEGDGEHRDDVWGAYFLDGLIMRNARKIVVEASDPGLLEQPCGLETQIVSNQEEIE